MARSRSQAKGKDSNKVTVEILEGSVLNKSSGGILSKLFRTILKDTKKINNIKALISDYEKNSKKDKSQIQTQLISEDMTWRSFCDLIVNLLDVKSFSVNIELVHKDDSVTKHKATATPNNNMANQIEEKIKNGIAKLEHDRIKEEAERVDTRKPQDNINVITNRR